MSQEITINLYAQLVKGSVRDQQQQVENTMLDQTGKAISTAVQAITTAPTAFSKGSVGSLGCMFVSNINTVGNVLVSVDNGATTLLSIPPGVTNFLSPTPAYDISTITYAMSVGSGYVQIRIWEA